MVMMFGVDSGLLHAVRGKDNKDYIVRVMTSGGEGHDHLRLVRRLSCTFPDNTLSNTHILPMVLEVQFKDITFGFFPKAQYPLNRVLKNMKSTVEDAVHMILQALEVSVFCRILWAKFRITLFRLLFSSTTNRLPTGWVISSA